MKFLYFIFYYFKFYNKVLSIKQIINFLFIANNLKKIQDNQKAKVKKKKKYKEFISNHLLARLFFWNYEAYHKIKQVNLIKDLIKKKIFLKNNSNIVELGCGNGFNLYLLDKYLKYCNLTGYDITPKYIDFGNKFFFKDNKNVKLKYANIDSNFFFKKLQKKETIDLIITVNFLTWIPLNKLDEFIKGCKKVSKNIIFYEKIANYPNLNSKYTKYYKLNSLKKFSKVNLIKKKKIEGIYYYVKK